MSSGIFIIDSKVVGAWGGLTCTDLAVLLGFNFTGDWLDLLEGSSSSCCSSSESSGFGILDWRVLKLLLRALFGEVGVSIKSQRQYQYS